MFQGAIVEISVSTKDFRNAGVGIPPNFPIQLAYLACTENRWLWRMKIDYHILNRIDCSNRYFLSGFIA